MDMLQFDFIKEAVEAVSANDIPAPLFINTLSKIYNLLVLWFWFDIIKYVMHVFEVVRARFNRFNKRR